VKAVRTVKTTGVDVGFRVGTLETDFILRNKVERVAFGVCAWMADRMGIQRRRVRMYFIYLSCLSLGSSVLFYLFAAFWLNVREYMREGKRRLIG